MSAPRLRLPAVEIGFRDVKVDGLRVGCAYTVWSNHTRNHEAWVGILFAVPGSASVQVASLGPYVKLAGLRAALEKRLEEGPWWV